MLIYILIAYLIAGFFLNYIYGGYPPIKGWKAIPYMIISPIWALVGLVLVLAATCMHGISSALIYIKRKD